MASTATHASFLPPVLTFLGAAVVGVPLVRLVGQSAVLGYLLAGVVIGPFGFSLIAEPETAASVAEIGVVLLLFIVGLELEITRLLSMRRDIFGLGTAQLVLCALVLAGAGAALGLGAAAATVVGIALALSATAVALQLLEERGDLGSPYGGRAFAVLLFQDISVVAILALLPLLASAGTPHGAQGDWIEGALSASLIAVLGVAAVVVVGRYGLNPLFRLLAAAGGREVMTAAALLVVLGTALLMEEVGLSMAMGAFLAGVMLAESNFRHQLEADIEPFRGMLLGLFFMSVGMSIDGGLLREHWPSLLGATAAAILVKVALVAGLFRLFGSSWLDAVRGGAVLAPAGEFAFVILPAAAERHLLDAEANRFAVALAALTMLLGPMAAKGLDKGLEALRARAPAEAAPAASDAVEATDARVLVVGFGRFGHLLTQVLLAEGVSVTIIDKDVEQIRNAARFGFRIYYGDGTRLDVLRAAGIARAELLCVCIDDPQAALKIVDVVHEEFASVRTYLRAYDRTHALELMARDVDFQVRETVESALAFGRAALEGLGVSPEAARACVEDVRKRDVARLVLQQAGALPEEPGWLRGATPELRPEPLTAPARPARALSAETRGLIETERREAARHTLEARALEAEGARSDA